MKLAIIHLTFLFLCLQLNAAKYNILDFGATPGGVSLNTAAINAAVEKCFSNGGGTVVVPAGTFVTGTIVLKSNVDLHLESGAVLSGSLNLADYKMDGKIFGIIFCEDAVNVSVSGKGAIQANGIHFAVTGQDKYRYGNKTIYGENMNVTNCVLKSTSSGIRIGYGQHPIRRCVFSNIVIHDSHRGIGIFAHDESNIEDLIFTDIIIETRLYNGQWWGHGEPVHLSCISRFEGRKAGHIKNVQFNNINAIGEQGILVYGLKESTLENISFNNVQLRMRSGKETLNYGGNFDLRPATPKSMQMFEHDIPGIYAQHVNGLEIKDFNLSWGNNLPAFFTHGIECVNVTGLEIDDFTGGANPNAPGSKRIKLENSDYHK